MIDINSLLFSSFIILGIVVWILILELEGDNHV
jgi:hypothetical protein